MFDLTGKTALVTGASRGIGRAIAQKLASHGARVVVHYANNSAAANDVVTVIEKSGGRANAVGVDLASADAASALIAQLRQAGVDSVDIFVSNAGVGNLATLEQETAESFDRLFTVNVRSPFFIVQQLLPLFSPEANIVFVTSGLARTAMEGAALYSASKGALEVLTRNLAKELGPKGIRVNAVAPGTIETDMAGDYLATEQGREYVKNGQALKRIGQPEDVADVVLFLASDQARWVTGRTIDASGGASL